MIKDSQEHLNEDNETYFQHMRITLKIVITMLVTGVFLSYTWINTRAF
jgi:hypothetical protein